MVQTIWPNLQRNVSGNFLFDSCSWRLHRQCLTGEWASKRERNNNISSSLISLSVWQLAWTQNSYLKFWFWEFVSRNFEPSIFLILRLKRYWERQKKQKIEARYWLWLSWQSGCFQFQISVVQIPSLAEYFIMDLFIVNWWKE